MTRANIFITSWLFPRNPELLNHTLRTTRASVPSPKERWVVNWKEMLLLLLPPLPRACLLFGLIEMTFAAHQTLHMPHATHHCQQHNLKPDICIATHCFSPWTHRAGLHLPQTDDPCHNLCTLTTYLQHGITLLSRDMFYPRNSVLLKALCCGPMGRNTHHSISLENWGDLTSLHNL